jgi:hypothetical protein
VALLESTHASDRPQSGAALCIKAAAGGRWRRRPQRQRAADPRATGPSAHRPDPTGLTCGVFRKLRALMRVPLRAGGAALCIKPAADGDGAGVARLEAAADLAEYAAALAAREGALPEGALSATQPRGLVPMPVDSPEAFLVEPFIAADRRAAASSAAPLPGPPSYRPAWPSAVEQSRRRRGASEGRVAPARPGAHARCAATGSFISVLFIPNPSSQRYGSHPETPFSIPMFGVCSHICWSQLSLLGAGHSTGSTQLGCTFCFRRQLTCAKASS